MIVRAEKVGDNEQIEEITINAFTDHPYSENTEYLIVNALRKAGALTISLVAEVDGWVVGHIAFSPVQVNDKDMGWYGVGPLSVEPEFQGKGIGSALMRAGLEVLREMKAKGCMLVGEPDYYNRFGFKQASELTIEGVPPEKIMTFAIIQPIPRGSVKFHQAFSVQT